MAADRQSQEPGGPGAPSAPRRPGRLRKVLVYLLTGAAMVGVMMFVASALVRSGLDVHQLQRLQQLVGQVRLWGTGLQCLAVLLIGLCWRRILDAGLRRGIVQPGEYDQVLALRRKVMAFLVAYLLLVPIGPATLFQFVV